MASAISPFPPDDNRGSELLAVLWAFTALATVIVVLKIYTRFKIVHETGLDDVLIFLSMVNSSIFKVAA